ncbi:hypothetical protein RRG08_004388 [Elysia crispata]|uniref:Uncharacterized protein n=1 Tax=Elysia crispata TaxID=231223 RepID=A0AAE1DAZ2_9GAST|nr:hypothetical protein RRG08_004388 [Elysia crispata]
MTEVGMTAQQFSERLDRMLNTPGTSLITSQGTTRPPWSMMLSGLWPLPSSVHLPTKGDHMAYTQVEQFTGKLKPEFMISAVLITIPSNGRTLSTSLCS